MEIMDAHTFDASAFDLQTNDPFGELIWRHSMIIIILSLASHGHNLA